MSPLLILSLFVFLHTSSFRVHAQVKELDDSFLDEYKSKKWLVEFYAPWCGHCKHFEPTYYQIGATLKNSDVGVGKIDATRYSRVADHFGVRGFPTVSFINGDEHWVHRGERTKDDVLEFVRRLQGPALRQIASIGKFHEARSDHEIFFLLVKAKDDNGTFNHEFETVAQKLRHMTYFFVTTNPNAISQEYQPPSVPYVLGIKDNVHSFFEPSKNYSSLEEWVTSERVRVFPKVTAGNFHEFSALNKLLVLAVLSSNDVQGKTHEDRLKEMMKIVAETDRPENTRYLQFGYTINTELVTSIAMWTIEAPAIFVLNTSDYCYDIVRDVSQTVIEDVKRYADLAYQHGKLPYGCDTWVQRVRRPFWEFYSTIKTLLVEHTVVSILLIGVPVGILSCVCYFMCCVDLPPDQLDETEGEGDGEGEEIEENVANAKRIEEKKTD